jgi:protein-disulfide isomerase
MRIPQLWLVLVALFTVVACGGGGNAVPVAAPAESVKIGGTNAPPAALPPSVKWNHSESPVPVSDADPTWGDRNAPVTLVVFSDFQCPFCGKVESTFEQVRTTYGAAKVRVVWKNEPLPFHDKAKPAAEAAMGVFELAGNDAFWRFHALAFAHQQELSEANYLAWAEQAGVRDMAAFGRGLQMHQWLGRVELDHELAQRLGVRGTPHTFVNGTAVSGAQPFEAFKKAIDDEMEQVATLTRTGVATDRVYVERSKVNFAKPEAEKEEEDEKEDTTTRWFVPVGKSPVKGKANAAVTIVKFSDFQCPFCKRVEPTIEAVLRKYGDKVRLVWKDEPLPFHPRAIPAARLALEARAQKGDAGFWKMHDALFNSQPKLDDADLEVLGKQEGLDAARVKAALASTKDVASIADDMDLADDIQATGTPHFFINGRRLVGAQPLAKFVAMVDEEIATALRLTSAGTPADKVYDTLMKSAQKAPAAERKAVTIDAAMMKSRPFRGAANAKVTILQFSDFQCPFCSRVEPTVDALLKKYGTQVKLVWMDRPLPMHKDARLAAEAAQEAYKQKGNAGFWKMHAQLFGNQKALSRIDLDTYATTVGLDVTKFGAAMDAHAHEAALAKVEKIAEDAKISGTPAFVINGYFVSGAQPLRKFERVVRTALAEANQPKPAAPAAPAATP